MIIRRPQYENALVSGIGNGLVKIVTGVRRCGKSFLLFNLFYNYLLDSGIAKDHIIKISLDDMEWSDYRDSKKLMNYVFSCIHNDGLKHFVIIDEIQLASGFVEVLLSFMHQRQLEVYVSGSNSKFLSKDVVTEFRGRGQEIKVRPLSFKEYYSAVGGDRRLAWQDYYTFGGLPQLLQIDNEQGKYDYLKSIFELTYLKDIVERNKLHGQEGMYNLIKVLASLIGSSIGPKRISNTFASNEQLSISVKTINNYINLLQDAFLIEEAVRYDVKGRKYIGAESKYYFVDMGVRAIALNFRQQEETHIMENIIYNELRTRGYLVDIGMVEAWSKNEQGTTQRQKLEIDFVVNSASKRVYIQSAYKLPTKEKLDQEKRSLAKVDDAFKKIIIVWDDIRTKIDDDGIITVSLLDFLLDSTILDKAL